jgi:hypothetical protein
LQRPCSFGLESPVFIASLIQPQVLAKHRKALIVYGHLHFQRYQILSNLDMSDWRTQTIVSLIERSSPVRVFTIWRLDDELANAVSDLASWPVPTLVRTAGTARGATDITRTIRRPNGSRFAATCACQCHASSGPLCQSRDGSTRCSILVRVRG